MLASDTQAQRRARDGIADEQRFEAQHAFNHAPAALRIFRFAADSAPRVLEIAHVSAFLRECAVEFGSADATLPGAVRNAFAAGHFFRLRSVVERNAARCPWLAAKLLACRSGAPIPVAALAPDVTRHDVNWGAARARRHDALQLTHGGYGLKVPRQNAAWVWAQGAVGVTRGKHWFSVTVTKSVHGDINLGFVDRALRTDDDENGPGSDDSGASGAVFAPGGRFCCGTQPLAHIEYTEVAPIACPCAVGVLLDLDLGAMTVFVNGELLEEQCAYEFPTDREWAPTVGFGELTEAAFSNTVWLSDGNRLEQICERVGD
jgi:hypothetical protein